MKETLNLLGRAEEFLKGAEESLAEVHKRIQAFPNTQEVVERVTAVEDQKRRIGEELYRGKCAIAEFLVKVWPVLAGEERVYVEGLEGAYDVHFWFSAEGEIIRVSNRARTVWDREDFVSCREFSRYVFLALSRLERRVREKAGSEVVEILKEDVKMREVVAHLERLAGLLQQQESVA
ncbi:MAG TPA: hypothetical protein VJC15_00815 [Candidatus Paceibacterota bacterium]